jgi:hypothetical protein
MFSILLYIVSGRWRSTGRVVGIYILFIMVERFILVPIYSERLFIIFFKFLYIVGLLLRLVWLLEHTILLVECIGFVWFVRETCISSNREVGMFSFVGPCRLYIPCSWQNNFHHRGHIWHNSIFHFVALFVKWSPAHLMHLGLRWQ